jgi:hypothetical protein
MVVLSSGAGRDTQNKVANKITQIQKTRVRDACGQAMLGRMTAAASLGLCAFVAVAEPADAAHRHRQRTEASKAEGPKPITGPLLLAISIGNQKVTVYDNGTPIATSSVSTGMSGHPTPTGIFSVIQKQRWHHSNIYSGAPMPYMQRITWSGVALHLGVVPGYPASHGCIRLPAGFAMRLWGMTKLGARVIVARGETTPYEIEHPRLAGLVKPPPAADAPPGSDGVKDGSKPEGAEILPSPVVVATNGAVSTGDAKVSDAKQESLGAESPQTADSSTAAPTTGAGPADPKAEAPKAEAPKPVPLKGDDVLQKPGQLSLFVSRREGKLFVRKAFTPAFDVPITIAQPEKPLGTHVFTASHPLDSGPGIRWMGVSLSDRAAAGGSSHGKRKSHAERDREKPAPVTAESLRQSAVDALDRIELPPEALARLIPLVTPGTSLVISDQGLGGETGSETDFIVVTK